ncbi:hypothetical protein [Pseudomonas sp. ES3-33]|uniref:hypothetical protein n=1 Tax=Pseudomonas sp. ES3-33 TaxID=1628833 RepID=UPI000AD121E0|nr:hypothetical protein [Pseudomonas sp. ES3-33]
MMSEAHCNTLPQRKNLGLVTHDNTGGPFVVECQGCGEVYPSFHCLGGGQIADTGDYEDARCPHCDQVDPEECDNANLAWNTQQLKINELQKRLNAADQRIDQLTAIAQNGAESEPPTYKPGLYAVRHIDNWDGERDVALTFAMLDADGKWTDKESGDALLAYRGDKVLRAWPLDCSDAPDTKIIGVPRNWLEDWALELVEAAQDGGQMSNQVEHLLEVHTKP